MPPDIGGYQRQFTLLGPHLSERVGEVSWIGSVRDSRRLRGVGVAGVRTSVVPAGWIPRRVRGIADLAVCCLAMVRLVSGRLRRRPGTLLLLSPNMVGAVTLVRVANRMGWKSCARFPSRGDQSHLRGRQVGMLTSLPGIVPSPGQSNEQTDFPVAVVSNAVELVFVDRTPSSAHGGFLYVGRLVRGKRPDAVVEAWVSVHEELQGWKLVLVGDGGSQRDSIDAAVRHRVCDSGVPRCLVVGAVDDPSAFFAEADVFVFPSLSEGLPNSMLEAMAMALPVIADPVLAEQWFGRPVPLLWWDGNADSLAEAMAMAAADPVARSQVARAAQDFASRHHAPAVIADRLLEILGGPVDSPLGQRTGRASTRPKAPNS